jgi:hypothetical protein
METDTTRASKPLISLEARCRLDETMGASGLEPAATPTPCNRAPDEG